MKKGIIDQNNKIIFITILVMLALMGLSGVMSWNISHMAEERCWDTLGQSVGQVADEIEIQVNNDQELLESIADIILQQDTIDSPEVQNIIDGFRPNTMTSHIALLLPGDKLMLPNEPIREAGSVLSFEEEAALGRHISGRSVDVRDESRLILRNFVPLIKNGETVAMLYGVVDLSTLPEKFENTAYEGQAAAYIIDGENGEFIMDTWHKSLGKVADFAGREAAKGYSYDQMQQDVFDGNEGYCVFKSKSIGEYLYYYYQPTAINKWQVALSVPESFAFRDVKRTNLLLIGFMAIEVLLLAGYLFWMLQTTKKELYEKQKLAETDVLTGLLNRNSYENNLETYPAKCKNNLTCIYADANGLHELNNTKGHAAGDKMLQTVAHTMQNYFGATNTYRVGGDEFVAFAKDESPDSIRNKINEINDCLARHDYHASIGTCRQEMPIDMNQMIKQAEEHMYKEKSRYYEQKGIDRRRRL